MAFLQKLIGRFRTTSAAATQAPVEPAPGTAKEWLERGNAALQTWNLAEAARCYRQAAAADPADPAAALNRGFVALEQGEVPAAIGLLRNAVQLHRAADASAADAQFLLGRACRQNGEGEQALAAFEAALAERPDFLEAIDEILPLLHQAGRHEDALAWARRLGAERPSVASRLAIARSLTELERNEEALEQLDAVLVAEPEHAEAWTGKGHLLLAAKRAPEAVAAFQRALRIAGPTPVTLANEARALAQAGRREEAAQRYRALVEAEPASGQFVVSLVLVLLELLRLDEAIAVAQAALAHRPDDAEIHWALSCAYLLQGDFARGWPEYEYRWEASTGTRPVLPDFGRARWLGEDIAGKTLLLAPEQGLGDSIQFLRYVPLVAQRAGQVLLSLTGELFELALSSGLPPNCTVVPPGGSVAGFDLQTSLMSLPLALGPGEPIPASVPYLRADPARAEDWRRRLDAEGRRINVGVVWSGNPEHKNDRNRSIPLDAFRAIEATGCRFISLNPSVRASDREAMDAWPELLPWGTELRSFLDTASLMECLDVIVAVDTSVVHLAGALGRPTRVLLPYVPDWRWMLGRADSPWYPTARLYRQPAPGDWAPVLAAVRAELEEMAAQRG